MTHQAPGHHKAHSTFLPQILELDAVIHADMVAEAIDAAVRATGPEVARILDIGAGTGAGTFALAARYPGASVVAVDVDEDMLGHVRRRAEDQQDAGRVSTLRADVAASGFDAGLADLVWSSNALHEVAAPRAAFGNIYRSLRPGGTLAVLEMDGAPLVLPQEHAPLEARLRRAAGADVAVPDWSAVIASAGFHVVELRTLTSDQLLPADGPGGAYSAHELRRLTHHANGTLTQEASAEVRAIVTDLSGRHEQLPNVHVRSTRTLWIARRP